MNFRTLKPILLSYCLIALFTISGCATKVNIDVSEEKTSDLDNDLLAKRLYLSSDLRSLEEAFAYRDESANRLYKEEIVSNMFNHFYAEERFREWMISFLSRNFSNEQLVELINQFESEKYQDIKKQLSLTNFDEQKYQKFISSITQTETNLERAETIARMITVTSLVDETNTIMSEISKGLKRANYFINFGYIPNTKMLLQLKELENNFQKKNLQYYHQVFEEMTMTLLYSLKDIPTHQLHEMHNYFNQKSIRHMNDRINLGLQSFVRDTTTEFTKELIVYMSEKHSDRLPAAEKRYR